MIMCAPCVARCLLLFLHFFLEFGWKRPNLGFPPVEGGISPVGDRRGKIIFDFLIPLVWVDNFWYDVMGRWTILGPTHFLAFGSISEFGGTK